MYVHGTGKKKCWSKTTPTYFWSFGSNYWIEFLIMFCSSKPLGFRKILLKHSMLSILSFGSLQTNPSYWS